MLIEQEDTALREYAKRLDRVWGEDAYHNVLCEVLAKGTWSKIQDIRGFFIVSIRRALYKIFRHEKSEREQIAAYIHGDPIPMTVGLVMGRQKHLMCRKGLHALVEENLAYIGNRRTCRTCKQIRERKK